MLKDWDKIKFREEVEKQPKSHRKNGTNIENNEKAVAWLQTSCKRQSRECKLIWKVTQALL